MSIMTGNLAVAEAFAEEMRRDSRVFLLGEDIGVHGGCFGHTKYHGDKVLIDEFGPDRVRVTPISESAIAGCALGAAMTGLRPVADIMFCDFVTCAMDQLVNQIAKAKYMYGGGSKIPLTIYTTIGGYVQNAAQHSQSLEAWFMHVPGLKLAIPSNAADAKGLMKTAIRDDNPVIYFAHKDLLATESQVPEGEHLTPFGKAAVRRSGDGVTIVATAYMVKLAMRAAEVLAMRGIEAEIIDPRTLVPLDIETIIRSVQKTGRAVVVQEAYTCCSSGAEIAARIMEEAFDYLSAPVVRVGAKETPIPYSKPLELACLPSVEEIIAAAGRACEY